MKILLISEYFPPKTMGGGEISVYLLAKNLAKKAEVVVLTSYFSGLKRYEIKDNIKILRRLKTGHNPGGFFSNLKRTVVFEKSLKKELLKLCKKDNFDIIHCMNMTSWGAVELKDKIKSKFVAHVNSPLVMCPKGDLIYEDKACPGFCSFDKFKKCIYMSYDVGKIKNNFFIRHAPILKRLMYKSYLLKIERIKRFDCCFAISSFLKKNLISLNKNIEVVPNIIEINRFLKIKDEGKDKILFLGDYKLSKGPHILLEALDGTKYKADFYGEGPLKKYLLKYKTKNVKIHNKVSYDKILNLYKDSGIVVFPSLWPEPFGRVIIEAMASERAVIASNIGGIKDIVDNNKNGMLVEAGNIIGLRSAIEKLMENKRLRKKLAINGRKKAVKNYNGKVISRNVLNLYKRIIRD